MARRAVGYLLTLPVLLCTLYFTRSCTACKKHKLLHGQSSTAEDCPDEKNEGAASDKAEITERNPTPSLRGSSADEGRLTLILNSTDIQNQVSDVVQRAVKHLEAQELLPPLQDIESLARYMLEKTGKGLSEADDKAAEDETTGLLMGLVRLISAVKAVRADVINVSIAWLQLKEAIHNLAEAEKSPIESAEKAAVTLTRFLEAELWMTTTTDAVQSSSKQLKEVLSEEKLKKAIMSEKEGEEIMKKALTLLQHL